MASPDQILSSLKNADTSRVDYAKLEARLCRFSDFKESLPLLAEGIDESAFPVSEWIEALDAFLKKVPPEKIQSLQAMVGYLRCCAESQVKRPVRPPLSEVLSEMLDEFGFVQVE